MICHTSSALQSRHYASQCVDLCQSSGSGIAIGGEDGFRNLSTSLLAADLGFRELKISQVFKMIFQPKATLPVVQHRNNSD